MHNPLIKTSNYIDLMGGRYRYYLPKMPSDEKEIYNYQLPKKDQVWIRPIIKEVKKMTERDKIAYIEEWRQRWLNGMWIFIDGEPLYLTGMNVDFLVFNKFDFGHPDFLFQQTYDFYFRDIVRNDTLSYGKTILKCRRCGMTAEEIEEAIYTLLEDENSHIGLQSNEYKKCLQTLMYPLVQAYLSRPKWMRELFYAPGGKKPRNSLELISNRVDVLNESMDDDMLGGTVRPYPTTPAAMDGTKKNLIIQDESFKWTTASPEETLDINKKCVVEYGIKGKVDVLSTMGDSDDYLMSVKEGCKLYAESNPKVRDPNGRTTSGLYSWFVEAIHSADIPEEHRDPAYTKYGKINRDKAEAYVWGEVNKYPKTSKQYVFALRRLPLKEEHALMAATEQSYFPVIFFEQRLKDLYGLPIHQKPYVRGRFEEDKFGIVEFIADEFGPWLIAVHPYFSTERGIDTRNRVTRVNGVYFPSINPEFGAGYDPIRYKTDSTTSRHLSKACIVIYKKFDYFDSGVSSRFAALYLDRPSDPKIAHKQAVLACRYYGCPMMIESQIETTEEVFNEENMLPFLQKNKENGKIGIWTNPKRTENGLQILVNLFRMPRDGSNDVNHTNQYPFEVGLEDKKNFDLNNTLESHVTMAEIMLMYSLEQILFTNQTEKMIVNAVSRLQEMIAPRN